MGRGRGKVERVALPSNVRGIEHSQSSIVLMIRHLEISFQEVRLCVSDICSVEEGTEEEQSKDGKDSAISRG